MQPSGGAGGGTAPPEDDCQLAIEQVLDRQLVDVDTVVLGGVYAALAPWLLGPVTDVVSRRVLAAPWAPVRVLPSRLGGEAAVRGAATAVVRDVIADPAAHLTRLTPV